MTTLSTLLHLGILAVTMSVGSPAIPNMLPPAAVSRKAPPALSTTHLQRSSLRRPKRSSTRSEARTRRDEPPVVILYGSRPWSWM
jgi:hypothetical protein